MKISSTALAISAFAIACELYCVGACVGTICTWPPTTASARMVRAVPMAGEGQRRTDVQAEAQLQPQGSVSGARSKL